MPRCTQVGHPLPDVNPINEARGPFTDNSPTKHA
ncbi:uncharacterized protein G2W53_034801 [Senna tora]|uniref:Uncharacterized protein n=1 Tax=Senna tora TaxID=362788 RepID=A0A834T392_9FABA|nr:uncharacterized protein G2W53_034801 [Senna tora]